MIRIAARGATKVPKVAGLLPQMAVAVPRWHAFRTYSDKYSNIDEFNKRKTEYNFNKKLDHLDLEHGQKTQHQSQTDQIHSQINQRYQDEELLNINALLEKDPRLNQFEYGSPDYKEMLFQLNKEFRDQQAKEYKKGESRERWKAVAFGVCFIVGVVTCHQFIMNYDWYMALLTKSSYKIDDEKLKSKDKNAKPADFFKAKLTAMLDKGFVAGLLDSESSTGLYVVGGNNHRRLPTRISFFNNMLLNQVKILDDCLVVVADNGKVYYSTKSQDPQELNLPYKAEKVEVFKESIYVLARNGELGYVPRAQDPVTERSRTWLGLVKQKLVYVPVQFKEDDGTKLLARGEKITQISGGDNHLLMLSSKGRLFNLKTQEGDNRGQFGVPNFSPVKAPTVPVNKVFEMALVNNQLVSEGDKKKLIPRVFTHISSGKFHNLASDSNNNIWAWGDNGFGQCGISVNYNNSVQSVPQKVITSDGLKAMGGDKGVDQLLCNEETSLIKTGDSLITFGNGLKGQLGNNRFLHVSSTAGAVKTLNLKEFDESTNQVQDIKIKDITSGLNHSCIKLDNAGTKKDVMIFGDNEFGQFGNGKVVKSSKPINVPKLVEPEDLREFESDKTKVINKLTKKVNDPYNRLQLNEEMSVGGLRVKQVMEASDNSTVIYYKRV